MSEVRVPNALFAAVKRDLRPVRPLASPLRRALMLLPLAIVLLVGLPEFWAWRVPMSALAPWPSWVLSALETLLSLVILAGAFREAVPGRELSTRALAALAGIAGGGFLVINVTTPILEPVPVATAARWIWECITMAMIFSVPALAAPAWLVARALPNRPALTGALCGLGVGLMADAGLRLFCWDGGYLHIVLAHGGAIAILIALGALSAAVVERIKATAQSV
jgi:hypothetical protein